MQRLLLSLLFLLFCLTFASAQTTGKIAGIVLDEQSGDPLIGANVTVQNTDMGAAAGADGSFFIM